MFVIPYFFCRFLNLKWYPSQIFVQKYCITKGVVTNNDSCVTIPRLQITYPKFQFTKVQYFSRFHQLNRHFGELGYIEAAVCSVLGEVGGQKELILGRMSSFWLLDL